MAQVFIGIGSSINKRINVCLGLESLQAEFGDLKVSPLYESEAVGFSGVNFYNLVVELQSDLDVHSLIVKLKAIERKHGRIDNAIKFAPRTLDLDLLLYDQQIDVEIDLPRGEITRNAFVLKPLAELAPLLIHPALGKTYQKLWQDYPKDKQKLWRVEDIL
ncbi:2-amino-4-hydroxy-6-hydroxymethyldihydropteridine diphosphokinase [Psychromonas ossibalaenae]|uniref:2-amino-4-hydroxy-6- hydroxymethyldihydropteridine diphosphokinase n=1 Tax=Psychromonas ossibalaenae TaxID=444922 RepID=UPI00037C49AF|nr:2-amino-4-hydroxy-6-hydroxymethyldihydropteridine diphosphokinase [Psychromonas ossibalaenae]